MYCRSCRYDLRGKIAQFCPECGRQYSAEDPRTFLAAPPTTARRLRAAASRVLPKSPKRLTVGFGALLSCWLMLCLLLPRLTHCGGVEYTGISKANLRAIIRQWQSQDLRNPRQARFDVETMKKTIEPRLSAWRDQEAITSRSVWQRRLNDWSPLLYVLLVYVVLMIAVCGQRPRLRRALWLCLVVLVSVILARQKHAEFESLVWPGDHEYLNDYAYVESLPPIKPALLQNGRLVVAYEKRHWPSGSRVVGFADGVTTFVNERELVELLAAQGLELQSEPPP